MKYPHLTDPHKQQRRNHERHLHRRPLAAQALVVGTVVRADMSRRLIGFGPLASEPNECVRVFGLGPEGKRCRDCSRLYVKRFARRYYKCELRKETAGPGSDHRINWRACARFAAKEAT